MAPGAWVVGFWLVSLRFFPSPYVWGFLVSAVGFLFAARRSRSRALPFALTILSLSLASGECVAWYLDTREENYRSRFGGTLYSALPSEHLGWTLRPGERVRVTKTFDGELIFDVVYTTAESGWRVTSSRAQPVSGDARGVVFLGGSFAMGHGLEDSETLPFMTATALGRDYEIHNFAVYGYGPNQMLAILGDPSNLASVTRPRFAIYSAITDHVARAAGQLEWARKSGPRYITDSDGRVRRDGNFLEPPSIISQELQKSRLFDRASDFVGSVSAAPIELFGALVATAAEIFERSSPDAEFHVILWDEGETGIEMRAALEQRNIRVHSMSRMIPDGWQPERLAELRVSPLDLHPSGVANAAIAQYVVDEIIR